MKKLKEIREKRSQIYVALQQCCDKLKHQLQELYDVFDKEETILMESLDLESD